MFSAHRKTIPLATILGWIPLVFGSAAIGASGIFTNELWSVVIRESTEVCPAIAPDGTIYLGTFRGKLWSITAGGKKKWIFQAGREIKSSPALGADGTIYFGCRDRKFYAVSPEGKLKWDFKTGGWVDSSPAVGADGTLYFGSWDNDFYALDREGAKRWRFQTGGPIVSSPAIGFDGRIYFGSHDRKFYALTPEGTKAWEYGTGGSIISSPAVDRDGTLYFTSVDGVFHAVNATGAPKWRLKTSGITESSPVIGQDGTLYVGVNEYLWAITPEGEKKWDVRWGTETLPTRISPVALADGSVLFLPGYGTLANLLNNLQVLHQVYLGSAMFTPAVSANGAVYAVAHVRNTGYVLRAFQGTALLAGSSWAKFRGDTKNTGRAAGG